MRGERWENIGIACGKALKEIVALVVSFLILAWCLAFTWDALAPKYLAFLPQVYLEIPWFDWVSIIAFVYLGIHVVRVSIEK